MLIEGGTFDALVYPTFDLAGTVPGLDAPIADLTRFERWVETLSVEVRIGSAPTPVYPFFWRTNNELILIAMRSSSGEPLRQVRWDFVP